MTPQEELQALRRMAELEARASAAPPGSAPTSAPQQGEPIIKQRAPSAWERASAGDIVAGLPATRMLAGAAAPVVGALQVGANVGDWLAEKMGKDPVLGKYLAEKIGEYEESKKRGMAALGDTGTDIAGLAGGGVTGGLALRGVAPASTWAGRIAQGTAVGAGAGATTPTATPGLEQTAIQTGAGAALGGAVPALVPVIAKAGQVGYRTMIEPFTNPEAIKGRAYMEAAGPKAAEIIAALRTGKPVVPGSLPTAGEAAISAGRPEFSALQASAEKVLPTNYLARSDARNAARLNQLGQVAGTEADMAAAQTLRKTAATQNYGAAMAAVPEGTYWNAGVTGDIHPGTFLNPNKSAVSQFGQQMGTGPARGFQISPKKTASEADVALVAQELGIFQKGTPVGQYLEQGDNAVFAEAPEILKRLRAKGFDSASLNDGISAQPSLVVLNPKIARPVTPGIDQDMAAALQPQIQQLMNRPVMKQVQREATEWAANRSIATPNYGSLEGLDYMKKALDRQIAAQAKGTAAADVADLKTLMMNKEDLLATIKQIAPKYDVARETFATQSKPINQMEVGQYLRNKLTPALDEGASQRAESFAGAVRDAPGTLKRSLTGAPRYEKLSDVLTPDQIAKVESVRQDLANTARQEMMAQRGAQAGPNAMDVATQSITGAMGSSKIPNPLSRIVTVANTLIGRLEGKINKELAIQIATEMLDPKIVAAALEKETAKVAKKAGTAAITNSLRMPVTAGGVNALVRSAQENESP